MSDFGRKMKKRFRCWADKGLARASGASDRERQNAQTLSEVTEELEDTLLSFTQLHREREGRKKNGK